MSVVPTVESLTLDMSRGKWRCTVWRERQTTITIVLHKGQRWSPMLKKGSCFTLDFDDDGIYTHITGIVLSRRLEKVVVTGKVTRSSPSL